MGICSAKDDSDEAEKLNIEQPQQTLIEEKDRNTEKVVVNIQWCGG